MPVALNVEESNGRRKWNTSAQSLVPMSEYLATILPNRWVMTDAEAIGSITSRYNMDSLFIPYGADTARAGNNSGARRLAVSNPAQLLPLREPHGARKSRPRSPSGFREGATT